MLTNSLSDDRSSLSADTTDPKSVKTCTDLETPSLQKKTKSYLNPLNTITSLGLDHPLTYRRHKYRSEHSFITADYLETDLDFERYNISGYYGDDESGVENLFHRSLGMGGETSYAVHHLNDYGRPLKQGSSSVVGASAGDFELFGPESSHDPKDLFGSFKSEDLPDLVPDSPQSLSPPEPFPEPTQVSKHRQRSPTPTSSQDERPKLYSRSSSSQLSRSDRSASVPLPSFPKPPRRRTQEARDQGSFFPILYGYGRSISHTSPEDSAPSSAGTSSNLSIGMGPGGQFWNPHTDHPLSLAEQEDLLDRVRRDLLGVNLEGLKGPLKALALSSQLPHSNYDHVTQENARNDAFAQKPTTEVGGDNEYKKTTVSPQEAFLDYDAIDHRLHSDPSRPYSSSTLGLGVGASGTLFAPLPVSSAVSQNYKSTTHESALELASDNTSFVVKSPSPRRPVENAIASTYPQVSRDHLPRKPDGSLYSRAPSLPTSAELAKPHQHHHHHHHHNGNRKQAAYAFATPRNAVSWHGRQEKVGTETSHIKTEAESSSSSSQIDQSTGSDEKYRPHKPTYRVNSSNGGGADLQHKLSASDTGGDDGFDEESESAREQNATYTQKSLGERTSDGSLAGKDSAVGKVPRIIKVKLADLHERQRDKSVTPSLEERGRNSITPTSVNEERFQTYLRSNDTTSRARRPVAGMHKPGSASPGATFTFAPYVAGHHNGVSLSSRSAPVKPPSTDALHLLEEHEDQRKSPETLASEGPTTADHHPRRTAAPLGRSMLKRVRPTGGVSGHSESEKEEEDMDEEEEFDEEDEESVDEMRPERGSYPIRKKVSVLPNKRRRRAPASSATTNTSSNAIRCTHVDAGKGSICGVVFRRPYDLARHKETIHGEGIKGGRKEWVCGSCGGSFSRKDALIRHARIRGHRA